MPGAGGRIARVRPTAVSDFSATLEMTVAPEEAERVGEIGARVPGVLNSASHHGNRPPSGCGETMKRGARWLSFARVQPDRGSPYMTSRRSCQERGSSGSGAPRSPTLRSCSLNGVRLGSLGSTWRSPSSTKARKGWPVRRAWRLARASNSSCMSTVVFIGSMLAKYVSIV